MDCTPLMFSAIVSRSDCAHIWLPTFTNSAWRLTPCMHITSSPKVLAINNPMCFKSFKKCEQNVCHISMNRLRALHPAGSHLHGIVVVILTEGLWSLLVFPRLEAATLTPNLRCSTAWLVFSASACASGHSSIPSSLACDLHELHLVQISIV